MNTLSWLLYLADTSGALKIGISMAGTFAVAGGVLAFCLSPMTGDVYSYYDDDQRAEAKARPGRMRRASMLIVSAAAIALLVAAFLPSRNTLMLIAASEVGETIVTYAEAQKLGGEAGALASDSLRLLRKYVSEQLGEGSK